MKLGNYEWDPENDLLAQGAFAEVFKARDLNSETRLVALKIYKEAIAKGTTGSSNQKKYSLESEFNKVIDLSHTNLVSFYGLDYIQFTDAMGRAASHPVISMELASEGTLIDYIKKQIPSNSEKAKIVHDILKGVNYLHEELIIHRDLKPGNVLITKTRKGSLVAKITDFGISRDTLDEKNIEQSYTEGIGTPHYMAPEQFYKKSYGLNEEISYRTDIWGIGVIIYWMFSGELPFGSNSKDFETIRDEIVESEPDYTKIPSKLRNLVSACMRKKAAERPDNCQELLTMLKSSLSESSSQTNVDSVDAGTIIKPVEIESSNTIVTKTGVNGLEAENKLEPTKPRGKITYLVGVVVLIFILIGGGGFGYRAFKINSFLEKGWNSWKNGDYKMAYEKYKSASEYGSPRAYYHLAWMNHYGWGTDRDYDLALEYSQIALDKGFEMANYRMALANENGWGVNVDTIKAEQFYLKAFDEVKELADEEDEVAMYLLADYYLDGRIVEKNYSKAFELYGKIAKKGGPHGMSSLANSYLNGWGTEIDKEKAFEWYKNGSEINDDRSYYGLAGMYLRGDAVETPDTLKAFEYYKISAEAGNVSAQSQMGNMFYNGYGTSVDKNNAFYWWRKAAEEGNTSAQANLGFKYAQEEDFTNAKKWYKIAAKRKSGYAQHGLGLLFKNDLNDIDSANFWFRMGAHNGHTKSQAQLAYHFQNGIGLVKNIDSANYWFKKSAMRGYGYSQYSYANNFQYGNGLNINYDSANYWYRKAAKINYPGASTQLGYNFTQGNGLTTNYDSAFFYTEQAAIDGQAAAQFNMGLFYYNGWGVSKSYSKSIEWYKKSADQGYLSAIENLAKIYYAGTVVKKNYYTAKEWHKIAADKGSKDSQYRLGYMYRNGLGTTKSTYNAKKYYKLAANQGHVLAQTYLADIYASEENWESSASLYKKAAKAGNSWSQYKLALYSWHGLGGITKDKSDAKYWINKSCDQGLKTACEKKKEWY